jgi:hypothetical protein
MGAAKGEAEEFARKARTLLKQHWTGSYSVTAATSVLARPQKLWWLTLAFSGSRFFLHPRIGISLTGIRAYIIDRIS